jgi:putative NADH-flavin reductase
MKIALIGASGNAGSRILAELSRRGHQVTAIARDTSRIAAAPGVVAVSADLEDVDGLSDALRGHDAVVSAVRFAASDPAKLSAAVQRSGVRRYLVVGGSGSLEVAPGKRLMDTPDFPVPYRGEALAGAAFLEELKANESLEWTFLAPSAVFSPGERTGTFRLGQDELLTGDKGSSISFEDYPIIALVDAIEQPRHVRRRFTVGY